MFYYSPGTFGQVLECWDREQKEFVAIKIIRSIKKYREAAMVEIDVLQLLGRYDRGGSRYVLSMLNILALHVNASLHVMVKEIPSLQLCTIKELV